MNSIKIDAWWKAVLILGVGLLSLSLINESTIVNTKHLIGLSIGLIFIGFSNWIAEKNNTQLGMGGMFQWKSINHNFFTIILLIIGLGLTGTFGFLLIKGLV